MRSLPLLLLLLGCASAGHPSPRDIPAEVSPDSVYSARQLTEKPEMLNRPAFNQELGAQLQRIPRESRGGGSVTHRILVDETGAVREVKLVRSSGKPDLDRAVAAALGFVRYSPGTIRGQSVRAWAEHSIRIGVRVERM